MAAGSAVCSYSVYGHQHQPNLPLQLLSRSSPVCLSGLLNSWGLARREGNNSLPSSFPPPSWHNNVHRHAERHTSDFTAAHSPSTALKFFASLKRPHPVNIKAPKFNNEGGCHSRIGIVMTRPLGMVGCQVPPNSDASSLAGRKLFCGQIIRAAATSAEAEEREAEEEEREAGVDFDEYGDEDCEYEERQCGGEDDDDDEEEEASQGDDDCSGDEFNDSGCQYEDDCDGAAVQFFVDAFSDDDDDNGDNSKEMASLRHPMCFETSRTPFMSHLSVESGYVENLSDSAASCTPDTGTTEDEFDESECDCTESAEADELWKSFQEQTFFVVECGKARMACKGPLSPPQAQVVRPPSPPPSNQLCGSRTVGVVSSVGEGRELEGVDRRSGETTTPLCCSGAASGRRHVSFKPDPELVVVHRMVTWSYAYRSCRKGPWEQFVVDRDHFRRRAEEFGKIFEPCFAKRKQQMQSLC